MYADLSLVVDPMTPMENRAMLFSYVHLDPYRPHLLFLTGDRKCDVWSPTASHFRWVKSGTHGEHSAPMATLPLQSRHFLDQPFIAKFRYRGSLSPDVVTMRFDKVEHLSQLGGLAYEGRIQGEDGSLSRVVCVAHKLGWTRYVPTAMPTENPNRIVPPLPPTPPPQVQPTPAEDRVLAIYRLRTDEDDIHGTLRSRPF